MITLSNVDAERLLKYAAAHIEVLKVNLSKNGSTVAINEIRLLRILLRKMTRKLDKACPERLNNIKQSKINGKKI